MPHKEAAFAAVDEVDAGGAGDRRGQHALAARTDGSSATNTDGVGFLANLDEGAPGWDAHPGPAVVLGAGGAARAVVWALLERGFAPVHLVNRTRGRAEALAARFGPDVRPAGWERCRACSARRASSSTPRRSAWTGSRRSTSTLRRFRDDAVVTDIVYVPLETPLLAAARARGLRTVDGLGMLLHQAAPGFEHWFGRRPTVTPALRAAVLARLIGAVA